MRRIINNETQVVLISAVLANADSINSWLNSDESVVISGNLLSTTKKTVGFVNWTTARGQIQYVDPTNINADDFFVPRVIERTRLMKKPRERKIKYFRKKYESQFSFCKRKQ